MISKRQKVVLSRDEYREFTDNVAKLQAQDYELTHLVTHNSEEDTFAVELLGEHNLEELDRMTGAVAQ
mgnify:CR=1 FL=1